MYPALQAGNNVLVNKWIMGTRIFNIWDALEGKEVKIHRLPGDTLEIRNGFYRIRGIEEKFRQNHMRNWEVINDKNWNRMQR